MTFPENTIDRRGFLKLSAILSSLSLTGSTAMAQGSNASMAVRFVIEYRGKKCGVKMIPLNGGAALLSVRELAGNRRFVCVCNFTGANTNTVPIKVGKQQYQVAQSGGWFTTNVPGLTIGPPEQPAGQNVPAKLQAGTRGLWQKVKNVAKAVAAAVVVVATVVGGGMSGVSLGDEDYVLVTADEDSVEVEVSIDGRTTKLSTSGQVVLPPPGVPEEPGTWY